MEVRQQATLAAGGSRALVRSPAERHTAYAASVGAGQVARLHLRGGGAGGRRGACTGAAACLVPHLLQKGLGVGPQVARRQVHNVLQQGAVQGK